MDATPNNPIKDILIITPGTSIIWKAGLKHYRLDILSDDEPANPRQEDTNLGHMICWHRRYTLGDPHPYQNPGEFLCDLLSKLNVPAAATNMWDDDESIPSDELLKILDNTDQIVILPLWLYDHSGISMACGSNIGYPYTDQWDAGQVGYIYALKSELEPELNANAEMIANWKEFAEKLLKDEVQIYSAYLEGDTYGYILHEKTQSGWNQIDSCFGFYGSDMLTNGMIDNMPDTLLPNIKAKTFDIVNTETAVKEAEQEFADQRSLSIDTPMGTLIARPMKNPDCPGIYINLNRQGCSDELGLAWVYYDQKGQNIKHRVFEEAMMDEPTYEGTYINVNKFFNQKGPISENAPVVYICSPYAGTDEERIQNVENAKRYGLFAIQNGYVPYIAHLAICGFLEDNNPNEREIGIQADAVMLKRCDELWVFGDRITQGMSSEIQLFKDMNKPIKYFDITNPEIPVLMTTD